MLSTEICMYEVDIRYEVRDICAIFTLSLNYAVEMHIIFH